jgi:hypothetical protein
VKSQQRMRNPHCATLSAIYNTNTDVANKTVRGTVLKLLTVGKFGRSTSVSATTKVWTKVNSFQSVSHVQSDLCFTPLLYIFEHYLYFHSLWRYHPFGTLATFLLCLLSVSIIFVFRISIMWPSGQHPSNLFLIFPLVLYITHTQNYRF